MKPRVGIFQAEWALQIHTVNVALALVDAGYRVDLFLYLTEDLYGVEQLDGIDGLVLHRFAPPKQSVNCQSGARPIHRRLRGRLNRYLQPAYQRYLGWCRSDRGLLPTDVLRATRQVMDPEDYRCLIGVEKLGIIWAGRMALQYGVPYLYYNLELYTWDHPWLSSLEGYWYLRERRKKLVEERYHRSSTATIVQDPRRAAHLLRDNGVRQATVLHVHVSLPGPPHYTRSLYLQDRHGIGQDKVVILNFGAISERRWSVSVARLAREFPADWVVVLHGPAWEAKTLDEIRDIDVFRRVVVSTEILSYAQVPDLVASAHIGLVLYQTTPLADYLNAFSSEKLAMYLKCGVPVIAFNHPGYEVIEQAHCGVLIRSLEELPQAVRQILAQYDVFSANARECFLEHYEFSSQFRKVIEYIDRLPQVQ